MHTFDRKRRDMIKFGLLGAAALAVKPAWSQTIGPGNGLPRGYREMTRHFIETRRGSWVGAHILFDSTDTYHPKGAENTESEPGILLADDEIIGMQVDAWGYYQHVTFQTSKSGILMRTAVPEEGVIDNFAVAHYDVDGNRAFSPQAKAYAARNQTNLQMASAMVGGATAIAALSPAAPLAPVLGATTVALTLLSMILGKIVADPPDEHYQWREWADFGDPTWVEAGDNVSSELAGYVNHMTYCLVPCYAYAKAALVASNRASGAQEQGEINWMNWQLDIATYNKREMIPRLWEAYDALRKVLWLLHQNFNVDLQPQFISTTPLQGPITGETNPYKRATLGQEMFAKQVKANSPFVQWIRESLRSAKVSEEEIAFSFSQLENPRWPWLGLVDQSKLPLKLPTTSLVPANPGKFNGSITPSVLPTDFPRCVEYLIGDDWAHILTELEYAWRVS